MTIIDRGKKWLAKICTSDMYQKAPELHCMGKNSGIMREYSDNKGSEALGFVGIYLQWIGLIYLEQCATRNCSFTKVNRKALYCKLDGYWVLDKDRSFLQKQQILCWINTAHLRIRIRIWIQGFWSQY